ncbi:acyl--CoA ligase [Candidatus Njordibacter sp. Uisw_039]|uniref:acyl--CoA ligase n=1 Tax=Candidatus Njordibacter sp. Uisw_039 TaxID=3230972 RepID=UPI003A2057C4
MSVNTTCQLLNVGHDDAIAIQAPGRPPLNYSSIRALSKRTRQALTQAGIAKSDRVAIVLPNGPEMATAFVTISGASTTAPLNPAYRQEEFEFYLVDLKAKALVVEADSASPAVAAAQKLGIPLITLVTDSSRAAGDFDLIFDSATPRAPTANDEVNEDDVALILHTSGTTSRPKIVPLNHRNVTNSAENIMNTLLLVPEDRCLNIMPLFHIHGLIATVLSSLRAGASIYCTPGFNALKYFGWMDDAKPTWYSAVPTMHQAILTRASRNTDIINAVPLRFIRSSSSSLPPQVMTELEKTFNAPVIEAYGMTEAAHQMASNPLPPAVRKAGTVGIAAGPEVGIMNLEGEILPNGEIGEIVIRGSNITKGYENNPKANKENFTNGWFRTGDQGVLDPEGYVSITGRLKEIINRGGEKISPREVDEILMDHPAVQQCVTFAMPHPKLGEEVAAAVVLKEGMTADEKDIRTFTAQHLADFKVPRKILILDEIPKGATGKLQRIGLAEKLGLAEPK